MTNRVEHFDLTGKRAVVYAADTHAGIAVADAYAEAGAELARVDVGPAKIFLIAPSASRIQNGLL